MSEIWKKHPDYNYEISNHGHIRRLGKLYVDKDGVEKRKPTRILQPRSVLGMTLQVAFSTTIDKKTTVKFFSVNKLVAELFLPPREEGQIIVHHKDGDYRNNHVDNLEWITRKQWNEIHRDMIENRTLKSLETRMKNRDKGAKPAKKTKK